MKTLLLDQVTWDLLVDANGNIAVASNPYALAQDAASSIRVFKGECWYDANLGIDYYGQILAHFPPLSLMKANFRDQALLVTEVAEASVFITAFKDREVKGQVNITSQAGEEASIIFNQTGNTP